MRSNKLVPDGLVHATEGTRAVIGRPTMRVIPVQALDLRLTRAGERVWLLRISFHSYPYLVLLLGGAGPETPPPPDQSTRGWCKCMAEGAEPILFGMGG
jgi:hypothetical protein